ncbi:MAG: phosphate ABC transporter permease subunit PstC [Halococcoides sp.]
MTEGPDRVDLTGERTLTRSLESVYHAVFFLCAALSVVTTIAIVLTLVINSITFFGGYSIVDFLFGTRWISSRALFGILPLVVSTLLITLGSAVIALPLGVLTAIYLSEYASARTRSVLKPLLEILAGVPTVVYGYFALVYVTPALNVVIDGLNAALSTIDGALSVVGLGLGFRFAELTMFNLVSASIVVAILVLPMVSSISEDAMGAVPDSLREAGYGLGATKFEVSTTIVVPAAMSGITSSFILALSRAIGETMAVTLAAGMKPLSLPATKSLFGIPYVSPGQILALYSESGATMTATIVDIVTSDLGGGSIAFDAMFAIGLVLFVLTLGMNVISDWISARYREVYE